MDNFGRSLRLPLDEGEPGREEDGEDQAEGEEASNV